MIDEYKVYVKIDDKNRITAINSNAFLSSLEGWQEIDSGTGDRYHHAQGNYFEKPIMDERGIYRYKLVDGKPIERAQEEMDADYVPPVHQPSDKERIAALEEQNAMLIVKNDMLVEQNDMLTACVLEMSEVIYA